MKILFLVPYPLGESPSQRFRFEQYFKALTAEGHTFYVQSFLDSLTWKLFFRSGNSIAKIKTLIKGFLKRMVILFKVQNYDFVFIHREAAPIGPPIVEWIIAKILKKKIIYDFDDAIWMTDRENESLLLRVLKWRTKVKRICSWSYKVSGGNGYLCNYAKKFNKNVTFNPTTIDTDHWHNPELYKRSPNQNNNIIIGWTGSHSTLKYLNSIVPVIALLEKRYPQLRFNVIADQRPEFNLKSLVFIPWTEKSEVKDLMNIDIGIMPLPDDEWSKGKCGFKALQYMAMGIATVASPVGVNIQIVEDGVNGFLCATESEWIFKIEQLINSPDLRKKLGMQGKKIVEGKYSVSSNAYNFLLLFN